MTTAAPAPIAAFTGADFPVTATANSLAIVATAQADDLTATIAVDVYNSMGLLDGIVGALPGVPTVTLPAPGAGNFTVKVRNLSGRSVNVTPTIIVREPPM